MENIFVEFLPPWVETGLQPAFYDKESGTVLQQTARMYDRVNMLVRMFNRLSRNTKTVVENYIEKFNELHEYVDDYFENHFDEEIRAKIDEMVDDGSLESIILAAIHQQMLFDTTTEMAQYTSFEAGNLVRTLGYSSINDGGASLFQIVDDEDIVADNKAVYEVNNGLKAVMIPENSTINVMQFGMTGKSNYDADLTYLATYVHDNAISEVDFNNETYNTTQYTVFNVTATTFKMNFNGGKIKLNSSFNYYMYGIFTINMDKTKDTKCYILNGNFDGSGNPADFSQLNVHPKGGRGMFFINGARYVKADHLNFYYWFYSACLWTHYCKSADITNIEGTLVGGRSADNTEDARGDALYFGYVGVVEDENNQPDVDNSYPVNINVENCHFSSWEAIPTLYPGANDGEGRNGSQSGRCGMVLGEFSRTNAKKVFNIKNCYFYNYQRSLHIEQVYNIDVNVDNTTFDNYGQVLITTAGDKHGEIVFNSCTMHKDVDVIAMYNSYKYNFSFHSSNDIKGFTLNDCTIDDIYNGQFLLGKDVPIYINGSTFTVSRLQCSNSVYINVNNSIINFDKSNFYTSGYRFTDCIINGNPTNSADGRPYILSDTHTDDIKLNSIVEGCTINNAGFHAANNKLVFKNNTFNYDTNFINKDWFNTTRNQYISAYTDKLELFDGNIVNNNNSGNVAALVDPTANGSYIISNNVLNNIRINLSNLTGYKAIISNNKFVKQESSSLTTACNISGSKCVFHDNQFIGFTVALYDYSNATQYSNYTSPDGTTNTLIS